MKFCEAGTVFYFIFVEKIDKSINLSIDKFIWQLRVDHLGEDTQYFLLQLVVTYFHLIAK